MGGKMCCPLKAPPVDEEEEEREQEDKLDVEELLQEAGGDECGTVELSVSCEGLPDKDNFSRSDPFVICFAYEEGREEEKELIGRTETAQNNLSPVFITPIMCSRASKRTLQFVVYHEKDPGEDYFKQVYLGEFTVSLDELLKRKPCTKGVLQRRGRKDPRGLGFGMAFDKAAAMAAGTLHLATGALDFMMHGGKKAHGTFITIIPELVHNVQEKAILEMTGVNLDRPRTRFGIQKAIADYYVLISRVQGSKMMPVAMTNIKRQFMTREVLQGGNNIVWKPLHIKTFRLCGGNHGIPLLFQVFNHNSLDGSKPTLMGQGRATLAQLTSGAITTLTMFNENKMGNDSYLNSGEIVFTSAKLLTSYSFLDYIKRGFEINCTIAIDFSASNGANIHSKESLHFLEPDRPLSHPNAYAQAIHSICNIVGRYDKDQLFPCLGFGARVPGMRNNFNNFPVSLKEDELEIQGVGAILKSYVQCVGKAVPIEPTRLAPVLRTALDMARENEEENPEQPAYQLLVVFTDGKISDVTESADVLVEASYAPMSVLIVGLGDGDKDVTADANDRGFKKLREGLARPDLRSVVTGKTLGREVVNFVAWNEYRGTHASDFARAALSKVPKHFLSWVDMQGISLEKQDEQQRAQQRRASTASALPKGETGWWEDPTPSDPPSKPKTPPPEPHRAPSEPSVAQSAGSVSRYTPPVLDIPPPPPPPPKDTPKDPLPRASFSTLRPSVPPSRRRRLEAQKHKALEREDYEEAMQAHRLLEEAEEEEEEEEPPHRVVSQRVRTEKQAAPPHVLAPGDPVVLHGLEIADEYYLNGARGVVVQYVTPSHLLVDLQVHRSRFLGPRTFHASNVLYMNHPAPLPLPSPPKRELSRSLTLEF